MVLFGTTTLPYINSFDISLDRHVVETAITGREGGYVEDLGGDGPIINIEGIIYPVNYTTMGNIKDLADGTIRTLDWELTGMYNYDCIMLDPTFTPEEVGNQMVIRYVCEFREVSNP